MHWDSISDLATLGMWADPGSYAYADDHLVLAYEPWKKVRGGHRVNGTVLGKRTFLWVAFCLPGSFLYVFSSYKFCMWFCHTSGYGSCHALHIRYTVPIYMRIYTVGSACASSCGVWLAQWSVRMNARTARAQVRVPVHCMIAILPPRVCIDF